MDRGVLTHHMPCGLQTLRCHHLPRHNNKNNAWRPRRRLSCKAAIDRVDRRDVILGGAAAAAGLAATQRRDSALADPILPPDLGKCRPVQHEVDLLHDINCCPPYRPATEIVEFEPPPASSPLRMRQPAHQLVDDKAYLDKYEKAMARMKALPDDDPRSFYQQWRVHCAYCEGAYPQACIPDREIEIHGCWLFFPWHRLYLYFHERILGKLIGDDTFALPFWNWDAPDGMTFPAIYTNEASPLYNNNRNPMHQPPVTVDLDYGCQDDVPLPRKELIERNLRIMYRQMISGAKTQTQFFGQHYCQGDKPYPGAGTIENQPHNLVHNWTGDPGPENCGEDMGVLGTAARDPVFFAHHGNVDRMWYIWKNHDPSPEWPAKTDFHYPDWLDASFLFYDEEARLVRVRVRDCLEITALRYTYQDVPIPWLHARPTPAVGVPEPADGPAGELFPRTLGDKTVRVEVRRERTSREAEENGEEEEVLAIKGIRIADSGRCVKFDVFVNAPRGWATDAAAAQCAGSFALTPHAMRGSIETAATFGITDLLHDIGADRDRTIVVSIVPRAGGDTVTIGGVSIDYKSINE